MYNGKNSFKVCLKSGVLLILLCIAFLTILFWSALMLNIKSLNFLLSTSGSLPSKVSKAAISICSNKEKPSAFSMSINFLPLNVKPWPSLDLSLILPFNFSSNITSAPLLVSATSKLPPASVVKEDALGVVMYSFLTSNKADCVLPPWPLALPYTKLNKLWKLPLT